MALDDFWWTVNSGYRVLLRSRPFGLPSCGRGSLEKRLRNAVPWLTPAAVEGFDPDDFAFLSPSEREELNVLRRAISASGGDGTG